MCSLLLGSLERQRPLPLAAWQAPGLQANEVQGHEEGQRVLQGLIVWGGGGRDAARAGPTTGGRSTESGLGGS